MAPKRGWCKYCLDDYRHGDIIIRCTSCPRSFHKECLEHQLGPTSLAELEAEGYTCDSCVQYAQELEIVNDERCKICRERNRDESDVLLLCDGCPNSYHMSCLELQVEPDTEKWYCPMCRPEAFERVNVRRRNPLMEASEHVNSSICYVCQRHGKLLGCDFCSNSFHYDCLPEFDIDTISDTWECPCCRGEDPFINQMHKRWTVAQIEKNSKTRRKCMLLWRGVITRYRNRFILAHRSELSTFVTPKIMDQLMRSFLSNKSKSKKNKYTDVQTHLELLQEEQSIESNKFVIKARKSTYYPSGRIKDNRPMRSGVNLKPHQEDGVDWLLKSFLTGGAILADEMGLGKTIQTLCFLSYLKMMNIEGPHLIVVPLSTVGNWLREIHRFTPHLTVIKICGSKTERQHAMSDRLSYSGLYDLFVTTYETVKCEEGFFVETVPRWQCLILDEAHRIKNQSGAVRHSMDRIVSNMRLLLTGTPLQNNAQELFTLINFMFPDLFRDSEIMERAFNVKRRFQQTDDMEFTTQDLEAIKLLLSTIMLRRLKEEAISLPKKVFHDVWLPLSHETLKWYRTLMNIKSLMRDNVSIKKLLGIVIKMRIVCGHPRGIVSRAPQMEKLFEFFQQEEARVLKKMEEEANELKNLTGKPHIHASAKLTFLDKLLCQLHYENCRLVPEYYKKYNQHLKSLDQSLYRHFTTSNAGNTTGGGHNVVNLSKAVNVIKGETVESAPQVKKESEISPNGGIKKEFGSYMDNKSSTFEKMEVDRDNVRVKDGDRNKQSLERKDVEKETENILKLYMNVKEKENGEAKEMTSNMMESMKGGISLMARNMEFKKIMETMQSSNNELVKSGNMGGPMIGNALQKSFELRGNESSVQKRDEINKIGFMKLMESTSSMGMFGDKVVTKMENIDKEEKSTLDKVQNSLENKEDGKDGKVDKLDKVEKVEEKVIEVKKEEKQSRKKKKPSKQEVLSKLDNEFVRIPCNTSSLDLYLSESIKQVNLSQNCPYVSMRIYENALEQEDKYKNTKKRAYRFESTKLVDSLPREEETIPYYANDPNKKTTKIIESDDEFEDNNKNMEEKNGGDEEDMDLDDEESKEVVDEEKMDSKNAFKKDDEKMDVDGAEVVGKHLGYKQLDKMNGRRTEKTQSELENVNKDSTMGSKEGSEVKDGKEASEYRDKLGGNKREGNEEKSNEKKSSDKSSEKKSSEKNEGEKLSKEEDEKEVSLGGRDEKNDEEEEDNKVKMHKVLVFTQFQLVLDELEKYCINRGWKYMRLDGSTNKLIRELDIREFNNPKSNYFVYLISTRAGGLGINLTAANHVVLYDEDWNPFIDLQAIDRAHRIGQKRTVHIWKLISEWTVEERMALIREKKLKLDKLILHTSKEAQPIENEEGTKGTVNAMNSKGEEGKLLEEDDVIISLSHTAILKMMMHGNKALQYTDCESIVDMKLDQIVERKRRVPPEHLDDTDDVVEDIVVTTGGEVEEEDRVIIELVKEDEEDDTELSQKRTRKGGLRMLDLINEEDVKPEPEPVQMEIEENVDNEGENVDNDGENEGENDSDTKMEEKSLEKYGKRTRLVMEMEKAGLLWRSGREKKKPTLIYTPTVWQKRTETRVLKHETKCFSCGKPKNHKAVYKDKDENEVELDYGDLIKCFRCPKSYHKVCENLSSIKRTWSCRWHECCLCFRKSSQCGNLLIHCSNCPTSFCYDCFPPDYSRHYVSDEYYFSLNQKGMVANQTNWIFFLCSRCKIESERKKRSLSGEERDKHKKEQKELRSQLISTLKDKQMSYKETKRMKTMHNKQEKDRIDEMKAQEQALEDRLRKLYQSLFPVNLIEELNNRINNDILNTNPSETSLRAPKRAADESKVAKGPELKGEMGSSDATSVGRGTSTSSTSQVKTQEGQENSTTPLKSEESSTTPLKGQETSTALIKGQENSTTPLKGQERPERASRREASRAVKNEESEEAEERDDDWAVGVRVKRRGLNFSNVRLPYKLLLFCENCRLPLHNVYKNPAPCPFPSEYVKLDLEIRIHKHKPVPLNTNDIDNFNHVIKSNTMNMLSNSVRKESTIDERLEMADKDTREDKKIIKKCYCSLCYEKRGLRNAHLRRHCEFLDEEEKKEYKQRREKLEAAMGILTTLASTKPNDIDYRLYNNSKLKAVYNYMLDQCDAIFLKALINVGLLPDQPDLDTLFKSSPNVERDTPDRETPAIRPRSERRTEQSKSVPVRQERRPPAVEAPRQEGQQSGQAPADVKSFSTIYQSQHMGKLLLPIVQNPNEKYK
ncbi:SWI/SNF-related chromatin remodelling factor [Theileria orientalis]|uniref:SWI/SNF-related chromatin remodelling factor n=1 Tax=Theileria orientalis TaxID=68886 RepID=A0A976QVC1_THEOR|nr:SWI/SNF-related chromatin remodelling factor [Theileria orientalis]